MSRHAQLRRGESALQEPRLKDTRVRGERRHGGSGGERKKKYKRKKKVEGNYSFLRWGGERKARGVMGMCGKRRAAVGEYS